MQQKSGASPQFCFFYDKLNQVVGTRDALSLSNTSILETRNTNKNTRAPTDLSSFVNPNKQNLCQDDEKFQEANHKENRRKRSRKKKENIEGLMGMNMRVLSELEEQQKFLEGLYKQ